MYSHEKPQFEVLKPKSKKLLCSLINFAYLFQGEHLDQHLHRCCCLLRHLQMLHLSQILPHKEPFSRRVFPPPSNYLINLPLRQCLLWALKLRRTRAILIVLGIQNLLQVFKPLLASRLLHFVLLLACHFLDLLLPLTIHCFSLVLLLTIHFFDLVFLLAIRFFDLVLLLAIHFFDLVLLLAIHFFDLVLLLAIHFFDLVLLLAIHFFDLVLLLAIHFFDLVLLLAIHFFDLVLLLAIHFFDLALLLAIHIRFFDLDLLLASPSSQPIFVLLWVDIVWVLLIVHHHLITPQQLQAVPIRMITLSLISSHFRKVCLKVSRRKESLRAIRLPLNPHKL